MPGPRHQELDESRLRRLLALLNDKLRKQDQYGEIYIVGGAMMILGYNADRTTNDIDSHIRKGGSAVVKAVTEIAREEGLSAFWLNEAVTMQFLPQAPDPQERLLYDESNLKVVGASTNRMIAMKLHAGRRVDLEDLDILLSEAGVETRMDAERIHDRAYGTDEMAEDSQDYLLEKYVRRTPTEQRK